MTCPDCEPIAQQLAAVQAEREEAIGLSHRYRNDADQLRAHIVQLNELLRRRTEDRDRYETAEGTAVAQRNAALNEALAYKYQAEAMRGVLIDLVVGRTCEAIDASARSVALAALDAATAGQPATPSNRPHPATSDNDSPTQAQPEVRNAEPSESHPGRHPAEAPGE